MTSYLLAGRLYVIVGVEVDIGDDVRAVTK